ncbi:MAG: hypothetical protein ACTSQW_09515 [Promethearchaeota archaeon]|jgi:hypothetical protein
MGVYNSIKEQLPNQFSIFQLIVILRVDAQEVRKVRNLLKQFHKQGFIRRLSKNMYEKIEK